MILPPPSQPPGAGQPAGAGQHGGPAPVVAGPRDAWDADAVLAGLDPDIEGLDLEGLAGRDEPAEAELYGVDPGPDDASADGWVAGVALAGPAEAFADGGPLEGLAPGAALAGLAGHAFGAGLGALTDDALIGLLHASRRLSAWQSGIELAAVAELDQRRLRESRRPGWSRVSEQVSAELAAALVLTGRSADALLGLTRDLARLPAVLRALLAGQIDRARAAVFAAELSALNDQAANAAAAALLPDAPALTTGQLRAALRTLVHCIDPAAVRRRMTKSRADARVETWPEGSGNLALAGRELAPADAVAADRRVTAIARALQAAGAPGGLDQLRAAVFTALLAGRDPETLLPAPESASAGAGRPTEHGPAASGGSSSVRPDGNASPAGDANDPDSIPPGRPSRQGGPAPGSATGPAAGPARPGSPGAAGGLARLGGSVHLTLPAASWLGLADLPGAAAGLGPLDAWTSRDLAARLAAGGTGTRWRVTLVRPDGTAAAHACARAGPGPPGDEAGRRGWLASLRFAWIEAGPCSHGCQVPAYRPPAPLSNVIRARNRTCAFPGCRRPAVACDLDHTIAWDQGGRTCPCNLAPLCRRHHRAKQAPGWTLSQPEPGVLVWTAPHGRSYTVTPSTYLC